MSIKTIFILALLLVNIVPGMTQVIKFSNGNWLIDGEFKRQDYYSVNGILQQQSQTADSTVDLSGRFVIPAFGDAHTHNLDGTRGLKEMIRNYISQGVFYVQVLGNYGSGAEQTRKYLETEKRLEARFANGLLTSTYGHGFFPYEPLAMGIYAPYLQIRYADSIKKSRLAENKAYYFLDTEKDVDDKWPMIMNYKPDIIKIILNDAINYPAKRKVEKADDNGLSETVARYVVSKAHAEGLRVFAHVETAEDARICNKIGVDGLAHLPGYFWDGTKETRKKYCITERDVQLFAKNKMIIIPTFNINGTTRYDSSGKASPSATRLLTAMTYKKKILREVLKSGIPLAFGADYFGKAVEPEIDSLIMYQVFSNRELIDIYSRQSTQAIFPGRKIGELRQGFEASFLVLAANPISDIAAIKTIVFRYKNGKLIQPN